MTVGPPFVVVAEFGNWRRVALAPDLRRPLVFRDALNASSFALGLTDGGVEQATVSDCKGGAKALAAAVDGHDAEPYSFEDNLASDFPDNPAEDVAHAYGLVMAGQILHAYNLTHPQ